MGLFAYKKARHAVIAAYVGGWLFLPMAGYRFTGFPDYNKVMAANLSVLLAMLLFDTKRVWTFRFRWIDVPMLIWCLSPFFSSISNGLGLYDGLSMILKQSTPWGIPYFIGRLYFNDRESLRDLAIGIFVGGFIYMFLCLWEIKMSPQLHRVIYGFSVNRFHYNVRFGGYRPTVFMQGGLMVGMWMSVASLVGFWLWRSGSLRSLWGIPIAYLVVPMFITAILCKAFLAGLLLMLGVALFYGIKWFRSPVIVVCLVLMIPGYMVVRVSGILPRAEIMGVAMKVFPAERIKSLDARMLQEDLFSNRAMHRPIFGWGGWKRSWPIDSATGKQATRGVDGFWTIFLGNNGICGIGSITAVLLLPPLLLLRRVPVSNWFGPLDAPLAVLSVLLILFMIDNLMNAMYNPVYTLIAGGLNSWLVSRRQSAMVPRQHVVRHRQGGVAARV